MLARASKSHRMIPGDVQHIHFYTRIRALNWKTDVDFIWISIRHSPYIHKDSRMHRYKYRDKDDSSYVSSLLSFQFNIESVYIQVVHHEHLQSAKIQKKTNRSATSKSTHRKWCYTRIFWNICRHSTGFSSSFCLYKLKRIVHTHSSSKVEEEVDWTWWGKISWNENDETNGEHQRIHNSIDWCQCQWQKYRITFHIVWYRIARQANRLYGKTMKNPQNIARAYTRSFVALSSKWCLILFVNFSLAQNAFRDYRWYGISIFYRIDIASTLSGGFVRQFAWKIFYKSSCSIFVWCVCKRCMRKSRRKYFQIKSSTEQTTYLFISYIFLFSLLSHLKRGVVGCVHEIWYDMKWNDMHFPFMEFIPLCS